MVATGGSAAMAIELGGAQEVRLLSIVAAPEGVFTAALGCLNDRKYILPGLGDFRRPPVRHVARPIALTTLRRQRPTARLDSITITGAVSRR